MTKSELLELIANGENSGVEFKGGCILLGVDDDGSITGIQRADLEPWVMDTVFGRTVHPMILPFYEDDRL